MTKRIFAIAVFGVLACTLASAQAVQRKFTKTERFDFGPGGTVSITGAPSGAIKIIGSTKREIEITADIELSAPSEADLAKLAQVTSFLVDDTPNTVTIITTGTHNKLGDKKFWKKFPSQLMGLPFRVDYTISVPRYTDLMVNGGKGDLTIDGVEGGFKVSSVEGDTVLKLVGGTIVGTFGTGNVTVSMPDRSWRGSVIEIALAKGNLNINLPNSLSAELDAKILRIGVIENLLIGLKPRDRKLQFTDRVVSATAGSGGIAMKFTVGDGTIWLRPIQKSN